MVTEKIICPREGCDNEVLPDKWGRTKTYCSRSCANKAIKKNFDVTREDSKCPICGKLHRKEGRKYCSRKCFMKREITAETRKKVSDKMKAFHASGSESAEASLAAIREYKNPTIDVDVFPGLDDYDDRGGMDENGWIKVNY